LDAINLYSNLLNDYEFYLAGGTALAFKLKYRVSYDLDFFTSKEFNSIELSNIFSANNKVSDIKIEKGTLKFNYLDTNISFFYYPHALLKPLEYIKNIKVADILDIALMKVTAIAGRGLEKDFADLYYASLKLGNLDKVLENFEKKFPNTNFEHYLKSLVYFEDADNGPRPNIVIKDYDWKKIKDYFQEEVKNYFNSK